jgi:hypothetical protein
MRRVGFAVLEFYGNTPILSYGKQVEALASAWHFTTHFIDFETNNGSHDLIDALSAGWVEVAVLVAANDLLDRWPFELW